VTTRDEVLARLRAAGPAGVSGQAIASALGISRAAVAKHVASLRDQGYVIAAAAGTGYRLESAPDLPSPAEVTLLVTDPMWVGIVGGEETASTNDDARALARAGAPEGTAVVAARQTAGRGRLGRTWESPTGGVYLSMVLRPQLAPVSVAPLALVVGLGVARGLEALGATPLLKWPNDVLLDGGKVAGILLEMSAEADRVEWVVAGVGTNVSPPPEAGAGQHVDTPNHLRGAAFLATAAPTASRPAVAAAILDAVAVAYRRFLGEGFAPMREEWNARDALRGADVVVRNAQGAEVASGRAAGVDGEGRLIVVSAHGTQAVPAGEVTLKG
jgi:BirA family transcriptional regulator, biotin operon repressor / biotin---[acetyl-CoA-carboxylase] ligase